MTSPLTMPKRPLRRAKTQLENSRAAARRDRIRAYVRVPGKNYDVFSKGTRYRVWYNYNTLEWECTCPYQPSYRYPERRCKHIVRVKDREEARIRKESLAYEREHYGSDK